MKSAVLLAGLLARRRRDDRRRARADARPHRAAARAPARASSTRGGRASGPARTALRLGELEVPGDFSSAAPFIVAATLVPGSELHLHGVGSEPTRTGLLDVLERMGGRVTVYNRRRVGGEPVADLDVRLAALVATDVGPGEVPRRVDELPLVALARRDRARRERPTGCGELREKETDRLDAVVEGLPARAHIRRRRTAPCPLACPPGSRGARWRAAATTGSRCSAAVAGLASREGVRVDGAEAAAIPRLLRAPRAQVTPRTDDRRHRRPGGAGKSTVARRSPRGSASATSTRAPCTARSRGSRCERGLPLDAGRELARSPRAHPVEFDDARARLHRRHRRHRLDPRGAHRPPRSRRRAPPASAR